MRKAVTHSSPLPIYAAQGACGKPRVVPHNRRPKPEPTEMGVVNACVVDDVRVARDVERVVGLASRLATGVMPAGVWL